MPSLIHRFLGVLTMLTLTFAGFACDRPSHAAPDLPRPETDVDRPAEAESRQAVLAAGCFWCVEAVFEQLEGVTEVVSGYAGGSADTANYDAVSAGRTDHAEAVRITYDPSKISFGELLRVFFATHDPTQVNRQGPDHGSQYRTAIFYRDESEKRVAEAYIDQLNNAGVFDKPIATTLEPLDAFYQAEDYHQDFVEKHPRHPYVTTWAAPKVEKTRKLFEPQIGGDPAEK